MSTDQEHHTKGGAMASLKNEEPPCPGIDFTYRLIEFLGQGILGLFDIKDKIFNYN